MSITTTLTVPERGSATFSADMYTLFQAINTWAAEANGLANQIDSGALQGEWVSGTTYEEGDTVWSHVNFQTYRRKTNGAGTTDPSSDAANWERLPQMTGYADEVYALTGTELQPNNGSIQTKTLSENTVFTESFANGQSIVLMLENGASYSITWPALTWVTTTGDNVPVLTAKDTLVFWKVGSTLYATYVGSYA